MKNQLAQTYRLFQDRPLPETPRRMDRAAALHLIGFDRTDYADSILRTFLALCLLGALAVCGMDRSAPNTHAAKTIVQHADTSAELVCATPSATHAAL